MEINKTKVEWLELIMENDVIDRLNNGEKFSSINVDLGLEADSDALRKAIKRLGYRKDKNQGIYYLEHQKEIVRYMNSVDIEDTIEFISYRRYFKSFKEGFFYKDREPGEFLIDGDIYKEYGKLSEEIGCDDPDDLIHLALLEWLDKNKPMNRIREFIKRSMKEDEYFTEELIELILKKEKEGYDLESLFYATEDYDLLELTEEEFEKHIRKCD